MTHQARRRAEKSSKYLSNTSITPPNHRKIAQLTFSSALLTLFTSLAVSNKYVGLRLIATLAHPFRLRYLIMSLVPILSDQWYRVTVLVTSRSGVGASLTLSSYNLLHFCTRFKSLFASHIKFYAFLCAPLHITVLLYSICHRYN